MWLQRLDFARSGSGCSADEGKSCDHVPAPALASAGFSRYKNGDSAACRVRSRKVCSGSGPFLGYHRREQEDRQVKKALLIVDVQKGLLEKKLFHGGDMMAAIGHASASFRKTRNLVVFIQHCGGPLKPGTDGWGIDPGLDRREGEPVIRKEHGNAFQGTELGRILEEKGIRQILVCGLVSHGCVRATCLGGREAGLTVRLLKDGHTNWAPDARDRIVRVQDELAALGIGTTTAADFLTGARFRKLLEKG